MTVIQAFFDGSAIHVIDKEKMAEFKRSCVKGRMIAMTLEYWEDARTSRQQSLLHSLLGRYARTIGVGMQWLKDRIKTDLGYWLPADKIMDGTVDMPSWRGKFIDLHTIYPELHPEWSLILLRSESDYTVAMERDFVDRVIYECQENDVDIEDILQTLHELNKEGKK